MAQLETLKVRISCHCANFSCEVVLEPPLPHEQIVCHCGTCRHVTGSLYYSGIPFRITPDIMDAVMNVLVIYPTSSKIHRFFCPTCGTHVMYQIMNTQGNESWKVCTGAIDRLLDPHRIMESDQTARPLLAQMKVHEYTGTTGDGGLVNCLPPGNFYMEGTDGDITGDWKQALTKQKQSSTVAGVQIDSEAKLEAACHCGNVRFQIDRPDDRDKEKESNSHNNWSACLCACRSCRLSLGQPLAAYLGKIPYPKITWSDGKIHAGTVHASVTGYRSSSHARRDFCNKCGASVFYQSSHQEGLLDVAMGLLRPRQDEGVLVRSWAKWDTERIHFAEEAVDKWLISNVERRLKELND